MYVLCKRLRVVLWGKERDFLKRLTVLKLHKGLYSTDRRLARPLVCPPPPAERFTVGQGWVAVHGNLSTTWTQPTSACMLAASLSPAAGMSLLLSVLLAPGPGEVSHPIWAGNRGQTISGALLLTRPLLGCHLTVEHVWRVDKEDKGELNLLPGKLHFRSVESAGMRMLFGSRAHNFLLYICADPTYRTSNSLSIFPQ